MTQNASFLIELARFNGVALGWAGWQLWSVRRSLQQSRDGARRFAPSEDPPRHSER